MNNNTTYNFVKKLSPGNKFQNNKYLCLASHHLKISNFFLIKLRRIFISNSILNNIELRLLLTFKIQFNRLRLEYAKRFRGQTKQLFHKLNVISDNSYKHALLGHYF